MKTIPCKKDKNTHLYSRLDKFERYNDLTWLCRSYSMNPFEAKKISLIEYMIFKEQERVDIFIKQNSK